MPARDRSLVAAALAVEALDKAEEALARAPVPGPKGEDGADGRDGQPGRDGKDGEPGKAGEPGRDGQDGAPGKDGRDGRDGRDGVDGQDGAPGEAGPAGRDGVDGLDGRDGAPGRRGIDGRDGRDAVTLAPARVTFERDEQKRTSRMLVMPLSGLAGFEVRPVRDLRSGLMVAADIGIYAQANA